MTLPQHRRARRLAEGTDGKAVFDPWEFVDEGYEQFFMASSNKWNHGVQVNTRMPPETKASMTKLVESKETPYKTIQDFIKDAVTKNFLWWQKKGVLVGPEWQEYVQLEVAAGQDEWRRRQEEARRTVIESSKERLERALMVRDKAGFDEALERADMNLIVMQEPWANEYSQMIEGYKGRRWE